jgi:hypothetical protein
MPQQLATNRSDNHNDNTEDDRLPEAVYNEPDDDDDDDQDEEQGDFSLNDEELDWCALLHNHLAHSSLDTVAPSQSHRDRTWLPPLWKSIHGIPPKLPLGLMQCLATPPFAGTRECV